MLVACRSKKPQAGPVASASASAAKPVDRLAPGELAPGKAEAFGLVLPRGMQIKARFAGKVHARGRLKPEDVANYIRERVTVRYVELGAAATIFPRVTIKGGPKDRLYTIEVARLTGGTKLTITDSTPPPKPPPGFSEAQLMERAGLSPDGKVRNLKELE
jgi:hypothetical protein